MDGVLADVTSSWQYVHQQFNSSNEHSVKEYMNGSIDDLEFIRRDVNLWKTDGDLIMAHSLQEILDSIPLMPGAKTLFNYLQTKKIQTAILSAGLDMLAYRISKLLHIPHVYANGIVIDETGRLTGDGILRVKLMYKDVAVQDISHDLHVKPESMIAVGNSCFDIPMLTQCGLGIAFNPSDDCVRHYASVTIEGTNLTDLIPIIDHYQKNTQK
jgi:phosphoserine phosphatase